MLDNPNVTVEPSIISRSSNDAVTLNISSLDTQVIRIEVRDEEGSAATTIDPPSDWKVAGLRSFDIGSAIKSLQAGSYLIAIVTDELEFESDPFLVVEQPFAALANRFADAVELSASAVKYNVAGNSLRAARVLAQAASEYEALGSIEVAAANWSKAARAFWGASNTEEAVLAAERAVLGFRTLGDIRGVVAAKGELATIYRNQGRYPEALRCLEGAFDSAVSHDDDLGIVRTLSDLCDLDWRRSSPEAPKRFRLMLCYGPNVRSAEAKEFVIKHFELNHRIYRFLRFENIERHFVGSRCTWDMDIRSSIQSSHQALAVVIAHGPPRVPLSQGVADLFESLLIGIRSSAVGLGDSNEMRLRVSGTCDLHAEQFEIEPLGPSAIGEERDRRVPKFDLDYVGRIVELLGGRFVPMNTGGLRVVFPIAGADLR